MRAAVLQASVRAAVLQTSVQATLQQALLPPGSVRPLGWFARLRSLLQALPQAALQAGLLRDGLLRAELLWDCGIRCWGGPCRGSD